MKGLSGALLLEGKCETAIGVGPHRLSPHPCLPVCLVLLRLWPAQPRWPNCLLKTPLRLVKVFRGLCAFP